MADDGGYGGDVLEEADVYKGTTSDDLFVLRRTKLYATMFVTYHDYEKDKTNKKLWLLDRRCELVPKSASDIREPQPKQIRPPGTWTLTAMIKSKGPVKELVRVAPFVALRGHVAACRGMHPHLT